MTAGTLRFPGADPGGIDELKPPAGLSPEARQKWGEIVPTLTRMEIVTPADVDALRLYCETWAAWVKLNQALSQEGLVYKSCKGLVLRPEVRAERAYRDTLLRLGDRLGLTPVGRRRLKLRPQQQGHQGSLATFAASRGRKHDADDKPA